ncbi:MAG: MBL fold metallo-hydrolase [bacterium]|nr:MBL fold metallo-hydrolase [bacterium]
MFLEKIVVGQLEANCYIFGDDKTREVVVIDPGGNAVEIIEVIKTNKLRVLAIINTHGHIDHTFDNKALKEYSKCPLLIHEDDREMLTSSFQNLSDFLGYEISVIPPDRLLKDNEIIKVGSFELKVIHTPGHTPGCISLECVGKEIIFTGDTLFAGGIGRTDLPGGSGEKIISSINKRLLIYSDNTIIYPGHGPSSTIGKEKKYNPFLK